MKEIKPGKSYSAVMREKVEKLVQTDLGRATVDEPVFSSVS